MTKACDLIAGCISSAIILNHLETVKRVILKKSPLETSKLFDCFFPDGYLLPFGNFLLCADVPIGKKVVKRLKDSKESFFKNSLKLSEIY